MTDVTFRFDGHAVTARGGQSLAAGLIGAGHRVIRTTAGESDRGLFCGMGVCQDCLVTVDGVVNRRACMTLVAEGIDVRRQAPYPGMAGAVKKPAQDAVRTIAPDVLVIGGGAAGTMAAFE